MIISGGGGNQILSFLVAHRATSLQYLVAETCFLVVPGVQTPDLSGPEINLLRIHYCDKGPFCGAHNNI